MRNKAQLNVVVATAANTRGIGKNGGLPWRLAKDMQYFKQLTCTTNSPGKQNAVVMGRKTWESIPAKFRPLTGRVNVVVSSTLASQEIDSSSNDVVFVSTFDDALEQLGQNDLVENVFVIGGAGMYAEAMRRPECQNVFLTQVYGDFDCDVFFPEMPADSFRCAGTPDFAPGGRQKEGEVEYEFLLYKRCESTTKKEKKELDPTECAGSPVHAESSSSSFASGFPSPRTAPRHEEHQYLDMIKYILEHGNDRGDRTGTGTLSTFGTTMRFSLRDDTFPLLTTKRVFWRGVAEELLWFISGDTSAKTLQEKNIHIWDGNGSREYLDKIGLSHREEGDLGPVYGFQWRHFGAKYKTMHDDYTGEGVDQLAQLIHTIKTNPTDRRMIISAWNPAAFHEMALPPCHMFAQFYVSNGELSCQMYQRSADMGLGVPFNIASYALLTRILAHCTDLKAGEFVHVMGDCHVYKDHVEPLREQLEREPFPFPKLKINTTNKDIDGFSFEDFEVVDYKCHKPIKMRMSV